MKELKLNIVNAHELDPTKKYILEMSNHTYTKEDMFGIGKWLNEEGIKSIIIISDGENSIKLIEAK